MTMTTTTQPTALLVEESMFGNTESVAEAIARGLAQGGLEVTLVEVAKGPRGTTWRMT